MRAIKLTMEVPTVDIFNRSIGDILRDTKLLPNGSVVLDPGDGPLFVQTIGQWVEVQDRGRV